MKLPLGFTLQEFKPFEWNNELRNIKTAFNGHIQFGTLAGADRNMDGLLLSHTFVLANTEEGLTHSLGSVPIGYLTLKSSNGGVIYDGTTETTKTEIFLKSTTANNTVLIFILR